MRILIMLDDLRMGGGQKVAVAEAEQMLLQGHELTILGLNTFAGVTVEADFMRLPVPIQYFAARRLLDPGRFGRLVQYLHRERFDILHTHLSYANILGAAAGRLAGIPVLATLHSTVEDPKHRNRLRESLETFALRYLANRVLAVAPAVELAHRNHLGHRHMDMIPNAVSAPAPITAEERATLRLEFSPDPNALLILSVGRLCQPKGYEDLIQAMDLLKDRFPAARLLIAGDGDIRNELEAQIDSLHLRERVKLLGTRSDVPKLLRAADIYVSSSRWEGMPLSILEAMMAGLPVVATRVGDIPSTVAPDTGRIVDAGQPSQLADAMSEFLGDAALRTYAGEAARNYALQNFDIKLWADRMSTLFRSMRKPASSRRNS